MMPNAARNEVIMNKSKGSYVMATVELVSISSMYRILDTTPFCGESHARAFCSPKALDSFSADVRDETRRAVLPVTCLSVS